MVEILYVYRPYYKRNIETSHFLRLCFPSLIYAFHICVFSYPKGGGDLESHFQQPNLLAGVPWLIRISKNTYKTSTVSSALLKCFNFFPYPPQTTLRLYQKTVQFLGRNFLALFSQKKKKNHNDNQQRWQKRLNRILYPFH